jgi:hypothetical protein
VAVNPSLYTLRWAAHSLYFSGLILNVARLTPSMLVLCWRVFL